MSFCSKVTILSLLDAYSQIHEQGQSNQKACNWQLTKARHSKGRRGALVDGILQGGDVREDLYAHKVLKANSEKYKEEGEEPALLSDNEDALPVSKSKSKTSSAATEVVGHCTYVLVDTLEQSRKQQETDKENNDIAAVSHPNSNAAMGIRRRKGKNEDTTTTTTESAPDNVQNNAEWTIVAEGEDDEANAEQRLRKANPIDFFGGLPPKELRKAQEEAEKMLSKYVQAANIIIALQEKLGEE